MNGRAIADPLYGRGSKPAKIFPSLYRLCCHIRYLCVIMSVHKWKEENLQSFADSSLRGIVERRVQCALSPMHLAKSAAGSIQLHSSMDFGSKNE